MYQYYTKTLDIYYKQVVLSVNSYKCVPCFFMCIYYELRLWVLHGTIVAMASSSSGHTVDRTTIAPESECKT